MRHFLPHVLFSLPIWCMPKDFKCTFWLVNGPPVYWPKVVSPLSHGYSTFYPILKARYNYYSFPTNVQRSTSTRTYYRNKATGCSSVNNYRKIRLVSLLMETLTVPEVSVTCACDISFPSFELLVKYMIYSLSLQISLGTERLAIEENESCHVIRRAWVNDYNYKTKYIERIQFQ